jgi:hypothetical protein
MGIGALIAAAVTVGFLTGLSWMVIASLIDAFREEEASFPQPQTEESGR